MTCGRAREFLERNRYKVTEQVLAGKDPQGPAEALALARRSRRLVVAKGARITELDLSRRRSDDEILELMLGPTGKLRAPTLRVGDTLYVGFPKGGFADLG